jgi:Xaa-Pro aminopeptidase
MITMTDYAARRREVLTKIGSDAIALIPAATETLRSGDTHYAFRQNSDFYYLTGFNEPEAILILAPGFAQGEFILFNRQRDPLMELWNGRRAGQEGAKQEFGADQAYPFEAFQSTLPELLQNRKRVYYPIGCHNDMEQQIMTTINFLRSKVRSGVGVPDEFYHINPILHEMRLHKSPAEIATMRKAAQISVDAHKRAMQACRPGMFEYELEAELLAEFCRQGARNPAYTSIIGSGANSCILHYTENTARMRDGDVVLIDAGGEYQSYASDITRTFPVNGKFTLEQKQLYNLVLTAQQAAIDCIRPGILWVDIQNTILPILTEGLVALGILQGKLDDLLKQNAVRRFYMHNSGHWLGLDTHDAGVYKIDQAWRPLETGFVLTVEPGLYIPADSEGVDEKWWNIGIRIEDDVVVTETGCEVLSAGLPKTVEEIEALMASSR